MSATYKRIGPARSDPTQTLIGTNDFIITTEYAVFQTFGAVSVKVTGYRKAFRLSDADATIVLSALAYLQSHDASSNSQAWLRMPDGSLRKTVSVLNRADLTALATHNEGAQQ